MSKMVDKISKAFINGKRVLEYWLNGNVHYFGTIYAPTMSMRIDCTVNESGAPIIKATGIYDDYKHKYRYFDFEPYSTSSNNIVGIIFAKTDSVRGNLTLNTAGRVFAGFTSIKNDGTFVLNITVGGQYIADADTKYTFRAVTWYHNGKDLVTKYAYSIQLIGTYNNGFAQM